VRFTLPLSLAGLATLTAFALAGAAHARATRRVEQPVRIAGMRAVVDHYRGVTWTFERAAHTPRTLTSFSDRRSTDPAYLQWLIDTWTRRAYLAREHALGVIHRRLAVRLPRPPALHARLWRRLSFSRRLTLRLRLIYPGHVSRVFAHAQRPSAAETLRLWQRRSALAALNVALHGLVRRVVPRWLGEAFSCIHSYEGAWDANTGNGYFGGLQMDRGFQELYGGTFLERWGTADRWPAWAQIETAVRAYRSGRGFWPWPRSARACGLL